ncbi:MAG: M24 family metallopeptidase [Acidobacteriota bacterium]
MVGDPVIAGGAMLDVEAVQRALVKAGLDGWLFYQFHGMDPCAGRILRLPEGQMGTRRWFYWIPAQGQPVRLVHKIEAGALDAVPGRREGYVGWKELEASLARILAGAKKVAMQYSPGNAVPYISRVDAGTVEMIRACGVAVVSSADLVQTFEAVLDEEQERSHFQAAKILPEIIFESFHKVAEAVGSGHPANERQIQQFIMKRFQDHSMVTHHPPIVAVDAHSGDPHFEVPEHGSSPIIEGSFLLLDIWAKKKASRSIYADITWTGYVGKTVPEKYVRVYDVVHRARVAAQEFIAAAFREGRPLRGCEADDVCRNVVREGGYADFFLHRTGHSIGEEVHGNGANVDNLETRDERRLLPRTCFSIEPGIYLEEFGVRSEVDMFIHADGRAMVTGRQQESVVPILA